MKRSEVVCVKIPVGMHASIDSLLDNFPRTTYPCKSDLLREALDRGLKSIWRQLMREKNDECACIEVHTCGK